MSSTLFISDLHLDADRPALTRAFARFLTQHQHCHALYILGDLFEAWIGDDDDSPLATEVQTLLHDFGRTAPVYFMRGNRDFLVGEAFATATGVTLLDDPTVIDLYGTPTLLMHGDTLCTADHEYQAFRAEVRTACWQQQVLAQPLSERRALAQRLRQDSGAATAGKPAQITDVSPVEVSGVMRAQGVRQLIHGHTHRPCKHEEASGRRWVLGDWDSSGWFIEARHEKTNLVNFLI